jgi:hypothetical protein
LILDHGDGGQLSPWHCVGHRTHRFVDTEHLHEAAALAIATTLGTGRGGIQEVIQVFPAFDCSDDLLGRLGRGGGEGTIGNLGVRTREHVFGDGDGFVCTEVQRRSVRKAERDEGAVRSDDLLTKEDLVTCGENALGAVGTPRDHGSQHGLDGSDDGFTSHDHALSTNSCCFS